MPSSFEGWRKTETYLTRSPTARSSRRPSLAALDQFDFPLPEKARRVAGLALLDDVGSRLP